MMIKALKSKTILFNMFMAGVEVAHTSIYLLEPVLTTEQFAIVSMLLGVIHGMGGVILRYVTTVPISSK